MIQHWLLLCEDLWLNYQLEYLVKRLEYIIIKLYTKQKVATLVQRFFILFI